MQNHKKYIQSIASYLNISNDTVFLYYKGRVALYAILKAYGIKEDDEVIIPAFTCVVVPNAIIYCEAKPIYVDIDADTYNIDIKKIEEKITSKTKVIIAQNTFGLAPDLDAIFELAKKYNLHVIEDCTHGFGGTYNDKKNGTIADASFFSTQWNKPFSTGVGGIAVVKDKNILQQINSINQTLVKPTTKQEFVLTILLFAKQHILKPFIYWPLIRLYRFLSKHNLVVGSSSKEELDNAIMPANFFMAMGKVQAKKGLYEVPKIDQYTKQRIECAQKYIRFFNENGLAKAIIQKTKNNIYLKFPLLVKDRKEFLQLAEANNIEIGEWFNSPIHPIETNYHLWKYIWGTNPIAEHASQHIVNLPTLINDKEFKNVCSFLITHQKLLLV